MRKLILLASLLSPMAHAGFADNAGKAIGGLIACSLHYSDSNPERSKVLDDNKTYIVGVLDKADLSYGMYNEILDLSKDRMVDMLTMSESQKNQVCDSVYKAARK